MGKLKLDVQRGAKLGDLFYGIVRGGIGPAVAIEQMLLGDTIEEMGMDRYGNETE